MEFGPTVAGVTAIVSLASPSVAVVPAYARDFHNGSTVAGDSAATQIQQSGAYGQE